MGHTEDMETNDTRSPEQLTRERRVPEASAEAVRADISKERREAEEVAAIHDALSVAREMGLLAFMRLYVSDTFWGWWHCVDREQEHRDVHRDVQLADVGRTSTSVPYAS